MTSRIAQTDSCLGAKFPSRSLPPPLPGDALTWSTPEEPEMPIPHLVSFDDF